MAKDKKVDKVWVILKVSARSKAQVGTTYFEILYCKLYNYCIVYAYSK